ncbi:hypothetical protein [Helicobacter sp. T3_23-1059]
MQNLPQNRVPNPKLVFQFCPPRLVIIDSAKSHKIYPRTKPRTKSIF